MKRYSRGRLKRASGESRQWASSSSSVAVPTTTAVTCWPRRSSATPITATSRTAGCAARTSSTSSGCTFSPPETIMSSTRPSIQRSPSSSRCPVSPVRVPAVADRPLVGVGAVPVAGEGLGGGELDADLAGLEELHPRVDPGPPGAAGLRELVSPDREGVDLGRAVVVHEDLGREHVGAATDERRGHRGARVPERPHRADVGRRQRRVVDEVVEEGRRKIERAHLLLLDEAEGLSRRPTAAATRSTRRRGASRRASGSPSCGTAA